MSNLSKREKALLWICFLVIFSMANVFAIRFAMKNWAGKGDQIQALESELADLELWLEDAPKSEAKELWLKQNTPRENSMTKAQGDLLQFLQDDLFERKIKIEKQSLQEPDSNDSFQEVAVALKLRGAEKSIIEWLTTLQGAKKFQVIKRVELELDNKSKEEEPQAICEIILARWFAPIGEEEVEIETERTQTISSETTTRETPKTNETKQ